MIFKQLEKHRQAVIEYGIPENQILGIFLYGSQNYNCDTVNSDVDSKAIIIPTYHDLCCGSPVIKELHLDNGEHCEIKDIREMVKMWRKQNINFLEIFYTKYCLINTIYKDIWESQFICNREIICQYNIAYAVKSVVGQVLHTIKQNPNDNKKLANGWRLNIFLKNLYAGINYGDCITLSEKDRQYFILLKNGSVQISADKLLDDIVLNGNKVLQNIDDNPLYDKEFIDEKIFNQGIINLCRALEFIG